MNSYEDMHNLRTQSMDGESLGRKAGENRDNGGEHGTYVILSTINIYLKKMFG